MSLLKCCVPNCPH